MDASLLRDAQATHQAAGFATLTKPTLRNLPFQRPAQMRINVILQHGSLADPATCLAVVRAGARRHRAEHPASTSRPGCVEQAQDVPLRGVCQEPPVQGCLPRQTDATVGTSRPTRTPRARSRPADHLAPKELSMSPALQGRARGWPEASQGAPKWHLTRRGRPGQIEDIG